METVTVNNVPIVELVAMLSQLHLYTDAVDITLYPEERRVVINPVDRGPEKEENPDKAHLSGEDLGDLI